MKMKIIEKRVRERELERKGNTETRRVQRRS